MTCRLVGVKPFFLNQCWTIVNWTFRNKLQWYFNRNSYLFIQQNAFENVVCKMSSRPQSVDTVFWCKVHPKKNAHGSRHVVFHSSLVVSILPIYFRVTSLVLLQSNDFRCQWIAWLVNKRHEFTKKTHPYILISLKRKHLSWTCFKTTEGLSDCV